MISRNAFVDHKSGIMILVLKFIFVVPPLILSFSLRASNVLDCYLKLM